VKIPKLAGQRDIALELDIHPHTIWRYLQKPGAPKPVATLRMGAVYLHADAVAWCKAQRKLTVARKREPKS